MTKTNKNNTKRQHYVPRFYLKNFGNKIHCYDKTNDDQFLSTPEGIAVAKNFYKINTGNEKIDNNFENMLSNFENAHAPAFKKLIDEKNYYILDDNDKFKICEFLALLHLRTEVKRIDFKNITEELLDQYAKIIFPSELRKIYSEQFKLTYSEKKLKILHLQIILDNLYPTSIIFHNMQFVMFENKTCFPFWTSDNPLTKENSYDTSGMGNLGLISKGIQFYLPLTPEWTLGIFDPTIYHMVPFWIKSNKMNTIRMNFLQVVHSSRFIYSKYPKFYLLEDRLNSNPYYRNPDRKRSKFLKTADRYGQTAGIISAERNLQYPVKPIGELRTWMDPDLVEDLHKKYNMNGFVQLCLKFSETRPKDRSHDRI